MFLPNKTERFTAALRNYIQNLISKNGLSKKYIDRMKKIIIFEAVNSEKETVPCDVKLLANRLFIIIYSRLLDENKSLNFSVKISERYIINTKLFTILLIVLALNSKEIIIEELFGNLIVKCKTDIKIKPKLLKALNSSVLYEKKSEFLMLIIKAEKTAKPSVDIKREWDISNPFSPINLFLS